MSWKVLGNVFKLIGHSLENTEFLTEFRIIYSKVPFTLTTLQFMFQMAIPLFCVNLRNLRVTLHKKKTQSVKHGIFRGTFRVIFLNVLKLIAKCSKWSKYTPPCVFWHIFKLIGHNLENTESSVESSEEHSTEFFWKSEKWWRVYFDHLEQLGISFKTFKQIPRKIPCFPDYILLA